MENVAHNADAALNGEEHAAAITPRDRAELVAWLQRWAGLTLAPRALLTGHASAADYLSWSFFEGRSSFLDGSDSPLAPSDSVVWANRGGGKTFMGAVATMLDLIFKPGIEIKILGGSMDQSKRMFVHLRRFFEKPALKSLVRGKITEDGLTLRNGAEVELLAQSQFSVRGTRVQKLRCDEVELFNTDVWEAAQLVTKERTIDIPGVGPTRIRGGVECLSTMHKPFGLMSRLAREAGWRDAGEQSEQGTTEAPTRKLFKWGVLDVLETCPDDHQCRKQQDGVEIPCPLLDECAGRAKDPSRTGGHVTIGEAIRMKQRVSQATWESEMLCRRPRRTDCVFPEFNFRQHVVHRLPWERNPESDPPFWIAGMDFGFRAPTVILLAAVDAEGVLWIVRERARQEIVLEEHAESIFRGLSEAELSPPGPGWTGKPAWLAIDPAGRQRSDQTGLSSMDVLVRMGFEVKASRRSQAEGLELVRARLKPAASPSPRMFIHARCTHLIECLEKYHYPTDDLESRVPVKDGTDHAMDALRYLIQNLDRPVQARSGKYLA